jgi:hypothetical protein
MQTKPCEKQALLLLVRRMVTRFFFHSARAGEAVMLLA